MEIVRIIILHFMLGFFILLSYHKILNQKFTKIFFQFGLAMVFAAHMYFSHIYIMEPVRSIIGVIYLGILLRFWQRSINWAALTLAFLAGYFVWLISLAISAPVIYILSGEEPKPILQYVALFIQAVIYFMLHKVIKLKNGITSINISEVKGIVFAATGIILAFFGGAHVAFNRVPETNLPLLITAQASLIIVVSVSIFFIIIFTKQFRERQREKMDIEKHRLELETQLQDSKQGHSLLKRQLVDMVMKEHKYKDVIASTAPALSLLAHENKMQGMEKMMQELNTINQAMKELNQEFEVEKLLETYRAISLPDEWLILKTHIVRVLEQCEQKGFLVGFKNNATKWEQITTTKVKLVRFMGNLLSNAMKELEKTDTEEKELLIHFYDDENGRFVVEVSDTAHEFPVNILARLGQRGNSTNNTGDGYADIFDFLNETDASFVIMEQMESGTATKTIQVVFDEKNRRVIHSKYRPDELKDALNGTGFEVI